MPNNWKIRANDTVFSCDILFYLYTIPMLNIKYSYSEKIDCACLGPAVPAVCLHPASPHTSELQLCTLHLYYLLWLAIFYNML